MTETPQDPVEEAADAVLKPVGEFINGIIATVRAVGEVASLAGDTALRYGQRLENTPIEIDQDLKEN